MQRQLENEIAAARINRFVTTLAERQAYKAVFSERLALDELGHLRVGNLEMAQQNIRQLTDELLSTLKELQRVSVSHV